MDYNEDKSKLILAEMGEIVKRKHSSNQKEKLIKILKEKNSFLLAYKDYEPIVLGRKNKGIHEKKFKTVFTGDAEEQKTDVDELYNMVKKCGTFADYKADCNNFTSSYCLYCAVEVFSNTFDHYFRRLIFPEYAFHYMNLIPTCTNCNEKKANKEKQMWDEDGVRKFVHPHIDIVPKNRYFFYKYDHGAQQFNFELEPSCFTEKCVDIRVLSNHYQNLELYSRYAETIGKKISDAIRVANNFSLPEAQRKHIIIDFLENKMREYTGLIKDINHPEYVISEGIYKDLNVYLNYLDNLQ